jgi:hypothetical protein
MYSTKGQGMRFPASPCGACEIMSSNNFPENGAKTKGTSQYFSLLPRNEAQNRPPNEDQIRGIRA